MKKRIKKLWIDALRSGKYEQTTGYLKTGDKYCCLGVLCDLHAKEKDGAWYDNNYCCKSQTLPLEVVEWAGLEKNGTTVVVCNAEYCNLIGANDNGCTFTQIADLIQNKINSK